MPDGIGKLVSELIEAAEIAAKVAVRAADNAAARASLDKSAVLTIDEAAVLQLAVRKKLERAAAHGQGTPGCSRIFIDTASGAKAERTGPNEALNDARQRAAVQW